jgi:hypothetical protein
MISSEINTTLESGTTIVVMYCPPDRDVARVTRTVDLQAHAQHFAEAYRARVREGLPDLHQGHVGDAWAMELWTSGILEYVCSREEPCAAHEDWMVDEHDYAYTLCIYPENAVLKGKDAQY